MHEYIVGSFLVLVVSCVPSFNLFPCNYCWPCIIAQLNCWPSLACQTAWITFSTLWYEVINMVLILSGSCSEANGQCWWSLVVRLESLKDGIVHNDCLSQCCGGVQLILVQLVKLFS